MLGQIANHDACSAAWAVIARRETSALRVLILEPMNGIPVPQCEIVLVVDAQYRQDTIKISRRGDYVVERGLLGNYQPGREQCQGDSRGATDEESRRSNLRRATLHRIFESGCAGQDCGNANPDPWRQSPGLLPQGSKDARRYEHRP